MEEQILDTGVHDAQRLKELQTLPLERKIQITQTRIIEWYEHYQGKVYVSFSGGKDSTVLLDLARRIYPDVEAVFVDTGLEYPEIREFVKTKENVTWLKPEMNFKDVIKKYGYPVISKNVSHYIHGARNGAKSYLSLLNGTYKKGNGEKSQFCCEKYKYLVDSPFNISDNCCIVMKKRPAHKYDKQSGKKPIIATMADESTQRRSMWLKNGCNAFGKEYPSSQPMTFWTEQDVLRYIKQFNIEYASVYGDIVKEEKKLITTGEERTGCMFCLYGVSHDKGLNRFQRMKITHPKLYEYCMKPLDDGGLGLDKVLNYINVKH